MAAAKKGKKKGQGGKRPPQRPATKAGAAAKAGATVKSGAAKAGAAKVGATTKAGAVKVGAAKDRATKAGAATKAAAKSGGSDAARQTRAARLEAARQARRRKALALRALLVFLVAAVVAVVVFNARSNRKEASALEKRLTAGSCTVDDKSDRTDPSPNNHVPNPTYQVNPPAGGNHSSQAAEAGTYEGANVPPDGQLVHSLEHGYVVVWHRPDLPDADKQALKEAVAPYERDVLVVPRASLPTRVAATAWGHRLQCPAIERGPLEEFIKAYRNEGPEKVPH